jgi:hypothetical protein
MTVEELAAQVASMRSAQKAYFRTRSTGNLEESKRRERALDRVIDELLRQPSLFDSEEYR